MAKDDKAAKDDAAIQPVTVDLLAQVLEKMPKGISGDDLKAILASQTESQKAIAESAKPVRHSNPDHLHISAFSHPEGDLKRPKGRLSRETYFNNHKESEDDLTPAEIEAFNAITASCEARDGKWKATIKGKRLFVNVPSFTIDDRMDLPNGLVLILRELAQGPRAADPVEMASRLAALEKAAAAAGIVVPA
jgi:hypothetical protein